MKATSSSPLPSDDIRLGIVDDSPHFQEKQGC